MRSTLSAQDLSGRQVSHRQARAVKLLNWADTSSMILGKKEIPRLIFEGFLKHIVLCLFIPLLCFYAYSLQGLPWHRALALLLLPAAVNVLALYYGSKVIQKRLRQREIDLSLEFLAANFLLLLLLLSAFWCGGTASLWLSCFFALWLYAHFYLKLLAPFYIAFLTLLLLVLISFSFQLLYLEECLFLSHHKSGEEHSSAIPENPPKHANLGQKLAFPLFCFHVFCP